MRATYVFSWAAVPTFWSRDPGSWAFHQHLQPQSDGPHPIRKDGKADCFLQEEEKNLGTRKSQRVNVYGVVELWNLFA